MECLIVGQVRWRRQRISAGTGVGGWAGRRKGRSRRRKTGSEDVQAGGGGVLLEGGNGLGVVAEEFFDDGSGLVASTKPDDFGGLAI